MANYDLEQNLGRVRQGYIEYKDREGWRIVLGIEQTELRPNAQGVVSALPPYGGAYPNFCIDNHSAVSGPDPVQQEFPSVEVHSYALVIPETRLITSSDSSQGAPFWINFNKSSRSAVVISLKGMNPLTYMPARAGLEYEQIQAWENQVRVQNWIPIVEGGRDWIDGFPTDPARIHEVDATVRQAIFTTNPKLGTAQYFIPPNERKQTLSFLFFKPVNWQPPRLRTGIRTADNESLAAEQLLEKGDTRMRTLGGEVEVAAGGLIRQTIARDPNNPNNYQTQPSYLIRFYPVTELQAEELQRTMPGPRDAITSMDVPTFGK